MLAQRINSELKRLFPKEIEILAEPGRFMIATAAALVAKIIGKANREGTLGAVQVIVNNATLNISGELKVWQDGGEVRLNSGTITAGAIRAGMDSGLPATTSGSVVFSGYGGILTGGGFDGRLIVGETESPFGGTLDINAGGVVEAKGLSVGGGIAGGGAQVNLTGERCELATCSSQSIRTTSSGPRERCS